jgi:hypothetical protein
MVSGSGPADPYLKVGGNERAELLQEPDFRFLCKADAGEVTALLASTGDQGTIGGLAYLASIVVTWKPV